MASFLVSALAVVCDAVPLNLIIITDYCYYYGRFLLFNCLESNPWTTQPHSRTSLCVRLWRFQSECWNDWKKMKNRERRRWAEERAERIISIFRMLFCNVFRSIGSWILGLSVSTCRSSSSSWFFSRLLCGCRSMNKCECLNLLPRAIERTHTHFRFVFSFHFFFSSSSSIK